MLKPFMQTSKKVQIYTGTSFHQIFIECILSVSQPHCCCLHISYYKTNTCRLASRNNTLTNSSCGSSHRTGLNGICLLSESLHICKDSDNNTMKRSLACKSHSDPGERLEFGGKRKPPPAYTQ